MSSLNNLGNLTKHTTEASLKSYPSVIPLLILTCLSYRNVDIIECKETNKISASRKQNTWSCVTREFNEKFGSDHNEKKLRDLYQNLKRNTKKKIAEQNVCITDTNNFQQRLFYLIAYREKNTALMYPQMNWPWLVSTLDRIRWKSISSETWVLSLCWKRWYYWQCIPEQ